MDSIIDLADRIGFDAVDAEVETWIENGEYDYTVMERARFLDSTDSPASRTVQTMHKVMHPDGPHHYTFCYRCSKAWPE